MLYIKEAGFKYLDYDFGKDYSNGTGAYSEDWKAYADKIKRYADRLGVKFVQSHAPMALHTPLTPGAERDRLIAGTKRSIEFCAELGIPNTVVHSGYSNGLSKEETFEKNKEFYLEILNFAEDFGVNVLAENFNIMCVPGLYWIDNAPDLLALIEYIDHPLLHACWDTGHANMIATSEDEGLRILGKHVHALHVQDNLKNDDHHMAPFMGSLSIDSVMNGLSDIGYNGYFTFEATNILRPWGRTPFEKDTRLVRPPLDLRRKAEAFLYEIGKSILTTYDCFEE